MLRFDDIPRSYVDAESEAEYEPKSFDAGFYDFKDYYSKLVDINGPKCFISGRKGTGKSAYIYRINRQENSILLNLEQLPYKQLRVVASRDKEALRYTDIWALVLINSIVTKIKDEQLVSGKNVLKNLLKILNALGFGPDIVSSLSRITKKSINANLAGITFEINGQKDVKVHTMFDLVNKLKEQFSEIKFKTDQYLLIDGVDDVLAVKDQTDSIPDMLGSLITEIYRLNLDSRHNNNNMKIIMAIRSDIWGIVNGADMNKRAQTNKLTLEWITENEQYELVNLLNQRLSVSTDIKTVIDNNETDEFTVWNNYYPYPIRLNKKTNPLHSWKYFLEYSLYRPRDVIKFMDMAKELYADQENLSRRDFKNLVEDFSRVYFFDEMRNEMTGFVSAKILDDLAKVLQNLGRDSFKYPEFIEVFKDTNEDASDKEIEVLLSQLFDHGYIGQRANSHEAYVFKHKNIHLEIDKGKSLVIHRGLYAAVSR